MKVTVTEEHIRRGIPENHTSCPIALAMLDIEGVEDPDICSDELYWTIGKERMIAKEPNTDEFISVEDDEKKEILADTWIRISMFVIDFDQHIDVKPFEFEIEGDVMKVID